MYGTHLIQNYEALRDLGLVRCKRDYAKRWLNRGRTFLRDYEFRDRGWRRVSPATTALLRKNLKGVAARSPSAVAREIKTLIDRMDRDERVAATMDSWGGRH
ncbi:hypothetical protein ADL19_05670 [Streptomyces purpurogeneiscleroticus]|nr:hypothetical protein ADL19_05670 [Streptomyces purpurogeneiscleroticus]